ncbi:alpha/beta hydrolase [Tamlana fucoidanivorans]|uniref:Alpha/beta hydrolase n=1 Tax=Allotamlana fucoidanivorans TaxID=2583814 RepID=A0A5C4SQE7_9FLAO|nr:alpha/beta hydrolase [Tamlana fucoidanivorans]TNJ46156.1 alpha/beta hydrolase [Tamlana fucoidanivorans]
MIQPKLIGKAINSIAVLSPYLAAKLAVFLFSKPRNAKLDHEAKTYLNTADKKNIIHQGFHIKTYHWQGNGETILLVHGWDSNSYRWKDLIELLKQEHYNIISVDAPAHGASGNKIFNAPLYAECLNEVIKAFKPQTIVGHSIGGTATAIALTNHNLPSICKIVLLGAPSNLEISVNNYITMMGYNTKVSNAINNYYFKHFGQFPKYYNVDNFFSKITAKGLIIHDKKDNIISFKEALDIHRAYKNSELIKTIGLGHRLRSETVYQHILSFIKTSETH